MDSLLVERGSDNGIYRATTGGRSGDALPGRVVVVGGGITGLAVAHFLSRPGKGTGDVPAPPPLKVTVVEAAPAMGGKVRTEYLAGFTLEVGPDSFVTRKPAALGLVQELGLGPRLRPTNERNQRVYVVHRGRLTPLPEGMTLLVPSRLGPVLRTPLLSWRGKARLALDLVLPSRRGTGDESLGAFVRRRFGREVLDRVAGPLLAGIHSADPERLSLLATFPRFAEMERGHGSLIRAVRRLRADRARARRLPSPTSARTSLAGGMGELVDALAGHLRALPPERLDLRTGRPARVLVPPTDDGAWRVLLAGGEELVADHVVLALPAAGAGRLVTPLDASLGAGLEALPAASGAAVSLGLRRQDVAHPLDGFGLVVPAAEGRRITACTWSSTKFEDRAPPGHVLLRAFVGGARGGVYTELADEDLVTLALEELGELLGITGPPVVARVHRYRGGAPLYEVGHRQRVAALEEALPTGLHLAGSAFHGVGLPDCIEDARRTAARIAERLRQPALSRL